MAKDPQEDDLILNISGKTKVGCIWLSFFPICNINLSRRGIRGIPKITKYAEMQYHTFEIMKY